MAARRGEPNFSHSESAFTMSLNGIKLSLRDRSHKLFFTFHLTNTNADQNLISAAITSLLVNHTKESVGLNWFKLN